MKTIQNKLKESKRCLVTGGAGFIGSHLVDALLKTGYEVIVLDNLSTGKKDNIAHHFGKDNFSFIEGNISDPLFPLLINKSSDVVIHLAAIGRVQFSFEEPVLTNRVNVEGTLNVLEYARKSEAQKFIFASSSSIYGEQITQCLHEDLLPNPLSPYGMQKWIAEQYVNWYYRQFKLNTIVLRFFNVFGPRQNSDGEHAAFIAKSIRKIREGGRPEIFGDGQQTRDFTYVSNVVEVILKSLERMDPSPYGQSYNIGMGKPLSVERVAEGISKSMSHFPEWKKLPPILEPHNSSADTRKAVEILGFSPDVSFEEGLKRTLAYFENQPIHSV